jgi:ABC-2 type transport system ATP-binding protein
MANSSHASLAVEAHDLVKVFPRGNVRALDGVSLQVEAGTVLGLLGPNGAGKTTVVRILSTILGPDSGHASVLGLDVVTQANAVRRIIGLAGQYAAVDENLTGRENIHMVARLSHLSRKVSARRADELLEEFGLANAGDRVLKTYSGGMRRRLDLAAALVANPPVLFLDEPTTGLDPQSRQRLWVAIEELVREGTTVLLTTQYLEEADRLARDIVVIDHGRVIAQGTPAQLKADLGTSVVSVTLGEEDDMDQALELLAPLSEKAPLVENLVIELTVNDGPKAGADVLRALDAAEIVIGGLALREPSLDDVFLSLTGHKSTIEEEEGEEEAAKPKRSFGRGRKGDVTDGKDAA